MISGISKKNKDCRIWVGVISLFPEMFHAITNYGVTGRAVKNGILNIQCWNPREFSNNKHCSIDDHPYGGGPGMLMLAQPLYNAIHKIKNSVGYDAKVIYLSPQGKLLNQKGVNTLAANSKIILLCGRYKGIDERLIVNEVDEEWSIGDYIISGGELAAMILIDSILRVIPGVLGHKDSINQDSFSKGILDCPHYTRPRSLGKDEVPSIILSGNHDKIRRWRLKHALGRTWLRRPEILKNLTLTNEQAMLLSEFQCEHFLKK